MKTLILGIDALGEQSLEALHLPKLKKLITQGKYGIPTIDNVVSRGWAELYSGKTAYETGAFYQIPILKNGRIVPTQSTGVGTVRDHIGESALLWSRLQDAGWRVGIYTLPTVTDIQKGATFSVSATGGGNFKNKVSSKEVYPPEFVHLTNYVATNLGFRMGHGAFLPNDIDHLERWMRDHLAQHFFTLEVALEKWPVDCLFFGTRFVTIAYKFIRLLLSRPHLEHEVALREMVLRVAADFDDYVARFVNKVAPEHLFIVSDHGNCPLEYHVNINELLVQLDEISAKPWSITLARSLAGRAIRSRLQPTKWKRFPPRFPAYDLDNSKSFSIGYTDVIYINDQRFTGPQMTDDERFDKASALAEQLKAYTIKNDLSQFIDFRPQRNNGYTEPLVNIHSKVPLPDIRCILAKGCVNLERTHRQIVQKNEPSFGAEIFENGFFAEYSGCKSTDTLAAYVGPTSSVVDFSTLTSIYGSIINVTGLR